MPAVASLNVALTANIARFSTGMTMAAKTLGGVRSAYARATDSAAAYEGMARNVGQLKLAGGETLSSLQTTLAVARSELRKFAGNRDVQVAVEIGREYVDEAWRKAKGWLQRAAAATKLNVAASVIADRTRGVGDWIAGQRRQLGKQLFVRLNLARQPFDNAVAGVTQKLSGLKQYRAVRITLAAVNATRMPIAAAMTTLGPLRKLATGGLRVALSASHVGIAAGVQKAKALFGQLAGAGRGLVSMLFSSFTLIGAGIAAVVAGGSIVALTHQSMEAIDVNAKLADRLGLTTEGLAGLQHAGNLAGVSSEALTGGLEKMLKSLGGAADDSVLASNAFTKLGLNAAQLANMPADQAFSTIAQKIAEIQNPTERAAAAMQIFGKSGQSLLPLMMSGAEGIKAAQEEAAKLGLTYSRVDAAKVEQANDAMTRAGSVMTGVGNQLAIGLSPYIEAAAAKFTELATTGGGIGPMVGGAVEWVARAIATASDYLQLLPAGFYGFRAGALQAVAGVLGAVDTLGGGIVKLMNLLPGVNVEWTDTFSTLQQGMEQVAAEEAQKMDDALGKFQRGDNANSVGKAFDDIKAKSAAAAQATADNAEKMKGAFNGLEDSTANLQKIAGMLDELHKQVDQFGMSDGQKKLADAKALGASPEQLAQMDALQKQLDALAAAKKHSDDLMSAGKSVWDDTRTPMEQYQQKLSELKDMLNAGAIDWDTYSRAVAKAQADSQGTAGDVGKPPDAPKLELANSAQAQRHLFEIGRGMDRMRDDMPKMQLIEAKSGTNLLRQIVKNTEGSIGTVVKI